MLPLAVLAGLIATGLYISRSELAETLEAPEPQRCENGVYSPRNPAPAQRGTSKHVQPPPGPRGTGPVAHFQQSQAGNLPQPPGILEKMAGASQAGGSGKKEVANFASISPSTPIPDIDRSRYASGSRRDGVAPFSAERSRAMNPHSTLDAAAPRSVDELRTANNPKLTARGRVAGPPLRTTLRGDPGELCSEPRSGDARLGVPGPGMSAVTRGAPMGEFFAPISCRDGAPAQLSHASRPIGAGYATASQATRVSNSELCTPGGGAAGGEHHRDRENDLHMYKESLCPPERGSLAAPPLGGAHASAMGAAGPTDTPGEDFKTGKRALLSSSPRVYGSLQQVNPPKQTTYDSQAPMRTTLKETAVHDTSDGFLRGPGATTARSPDADARTTGRETLEEWQGAHGDGRLAGTNAVFKAPVYDPNDIFETTTKETLTANSHMGNIGTLEERGASAPQPELDQTQRALSHADHYGGPSQSKADGYRVAQVNTPGTNRQIAPEQDYRGAAGPRVPHAPSSDEVYSRVIGDMKESVLRRRAPVPRRETLVSGAEAVQNVTAHRDPLLDEQQNRHMIQNQHHTQRYVLPSCISDTRGGRRAYDTTPDPSILTQLDRNPYVRQAS